MVLISLASFREERFRQEGQPTRKNLTRSLASAKTLSRLTSCNIRKSTSYEKKHGHFVHCICADYHYTRRTLPETNSQISNSHTSTATESVCVVFRALVYVYARSTFCSSVIRRRLLGVDNITWLLFVRILTVTREKMKLTTDQKGLLAIRYLSERKNTSRHILCCNNQFHQNSSQKSCVWPYHECEITFHIRT